MSMQFNSLESPMCAFRNCSCNYMDFVSKQMILGEDIESLLLKNKKLEFSADKINNNKVIMPRLFKSCHYCCTYYCSSLCRELDWPVHKRDACYYGNLASLCKRILVKIGRNVSYTFIMYYRVL